jgi:tRNA dimethylallyltransferase
MDIGTAKPTPEQRRGVPHHLIDIIEPHAEYSLAQYVAAAHHCIEEIRLRGREVLFVGGTPLYLKALLRGIFEGPPADWTFRRALRAEAQQHGPKSLHRRLAEVDPAAAERLHPNDTRRLIRALEVYEKTGRPISQWQQQFAASRTAESLRAFALDWPRDELHTRIEHRVEQMFAGGLVDEVTCLLAGEQPLSRTAQQALGYREVIEHLRGDHGLAETIDLVKTHTRRLARRQCTWFRSLSECRSVPLSGQIDPVEVAQHILATASAGPAD